MPRLAARMAQMKASEIRNLLKVTEQPGTISFGGGLPAPELFPLAQLAEVRRLILEEQGQEALQYSTTEGYRPLRDQIAARHNRHGARKITADEIIITSGSQQGLDMIGKVFLDEGDVILCESPTYLGALNAFRGYCPRFVQVETDEDGMDLDELRHTLDHTDEVKLIYVNPDFQNPTGRCWSEERRRQFMWLVQQYDVVVVEDRAYAELRYEGEPRTSLQALDDTGCVVQLGTFSKILCPGFRIGWMIAEQPYMEKFQLVKQSIDLHSSSITQWEIARYLELYDLDAHIELLRSTYRRRRDAMLHAISRVMPDLVNVNKPHGGLFVWAELPERIVAKELLLRCLQKQVVFVPGDAFYPQGGRQNMIRLNFSNPTEEQIIEGIVRLAAVIRTDQ
ncbi:PLP-dependent aminotransferase family protein [Brevibacillus humidisoli]|uniref:aminotransferase-like domain-containing protein n=1 Tax=Brevibacillus humidisoli TaxID=2895522 RepID=UPI001E50EA70|nr:PLP-dependent aminotransferase family protein [Brevibacillus humidisoli]UFJ41301.1 PLP-dependent aminotransferase family protein [Brevibacillus humidisoli]